MAKKKLRVEDVTGVHEGKGKWAGTYYWRAYGYPDEKEKENPNVKQDEDASKPHKICKRSSDRYTSIEAARKARQEWIDTHSKPFTDSTKPELFQETIERFYDYRQEMKIANEKTTKDNKSMARRICAPLLCKETRKISKSDLDKVFKSEAYNSYSTERRGKFKTLMDDLFNYAIERNVAKENPCIGIKLPTLTKEERKKKIINKKKNARNTVDLDIFYEYLDIMRNLEYEKKTMDAQRVYKNNLDADIQYCLIWTGLRIHELLSIRFKDVFKKNDKYYYDLHEQYKDGAWCELKNISSVRNVILNDATVEIINKYRLMSENIPGFDESWFVFRTQLDTNEPRSDSSVNRTRAKAIKILKDNHKNDNIEISNFDNHSLRHAYASHLLEETFDAPAVAKQMGHATIKQTIDTYWHSENDDKISSFINSKKAEEKRTKKSPNEDQKEGEKL